MSIKDHCKQLCEDFLGHGCVVMDEISNTIVELLADFVWPIQECWIEFEIDRAIGCIHYTLDQGNEYNIAFDGLDDLGIKIRHLTIMQHPSSERLTHCCNNSNNFINLYK